MLNALRHGGIVQCDAPGCPERFVSYACRSVIRDQAERSKWGRVRAGLLGFYGVGNRNAGPKWDACPTHHEQAQANRVAIPRELAAKRAAAEAARQTTRREREAAKAAKKAAAQAAKDAARRGREARRLASRKPRKGRQGAVAEPAPEIAATPEVIAWTATLPAPIQAEIAQLHAELAPASDRYDALEGEPERTFARENTPTLRAARPRRDAGLPTVLAVVAIVLAEAQASAEGACLTAAEIVAAAAGRLPTTSKTPNTIVSRDLALDVKHLGDASRFERTSPGRFRLRKVTP